MKKNKILILFIGVLLVLNILFNWNVRDKFLEIKHTLFSHQKEISKSETIDEILSSLEVVTFKELTNEYLEFTKSNIPKYKKLLHNLNFYKVKRSDLNRKIVGNFMLKEFICKDQFYKDCVLNKSQHIICLFNPKIFHKTLELIKEMKKENLDANQIEIVNGHRHPRYNEEINGAKLSRHIKGEAVDIIIGDINRDGLNDQVDKKTILKLLELRIIKDKGGIGIYPGTQNLHYDVRGYKARWNTY